jgi:hypothetical protein
VSKHAEEQCNSPRINPAAITIVRCQESEKGKDRRGKKRCRNLKMPLRWVAALLCAALHVVQAVPCAYVLTSNGSVAATFCAEGSSGLPCDDSACLPGLVSVSIEAMATCQEDSSLWVQEAVYLACGRDASGFPRPDAPALFPTVRLAASSTANIVSLPPVDVWQPFG